MAFKMRGLTPFNQKVATPSPDNYPMEGPSDFPEIKIDTDGTMYVIASYEASGDPDLRFNLPPGFSDYKGLLEAGDRIDETALEELFGMDELSDEPVEINPPK